MLNKDKRSLLLSLVIGDGCLHYIKNKGKIYGGLTIDHGLQQADYQSWKAKLLSDIMNKDVKVRTAHKGKSVQVSICMKRIRSWRRFCYPNNRKSIPKILKFIRHPEFALSVMLMDDGYVEPSISKLADGSKKMYGARLRFFICSQTNEEVKQIKAWLDSNFKVNTKIAYQWDKRQQKYYPFLKWSASDSLILWELIREFVLTFKSMRYKFRHIEHIFQSKCLQRPPVIEK